MQSVDFQNSIMGAILEWAEECDEMIFESNTLLRWIALASINMIYLKTSENSPIRRLVTNISFCQITPD